MEFAATCDFVSIGCARFRDADGDVAFCFLKQTVADHAGGHFGTFLPCVRRVVYADGDGHGWWINRGGGDSGGQGHIANGVCHRGVGQACDGHDFTRLGFFYGYALDAVEGEKFSEAALFHSFTI